MPRCSDCGRPGTHRWPANRCDPCWQAAIAEKNARANAGPTALYRLFDANGRLLYIGTSIEPERRFREHRKTAKWWPQVARREVEWLEVNGMAALHAELAVITAESPLWNRQGRNPAADGPVS